jgi:hypothetical protein
MLGALLRYLAVAPEHKLTRGAEGPLLLHTLAQLLHSPAAEVRARRPSINIPSITSPTPSSCPAFPTAAAVSGVSLGRGLWVAAQRWVAPPTDPNAQRLSCTRWARRRRPSARCWVRQSGRRRRRREVASVGRAAIRVGGAGGWTGRSKGGKSTAPRRTSARTAAGCWRASARRSSTCPTWRCARAGHAPHCGRCASSQSRPHPRPAQRGLLFAAEGWL